MQQKAHLAKGELATTPFSIPDEKDTHWFFDYNRLIVENQNRKANCPFEKETQCRQMAAAFVQEMGQRLHLPTLCVCSAIVYVHRFYVFHSFNKFPLEDISAAALFLAAKAQECPRKLEYVVKVSYALQHRDESALDPKSEKYSEESQKIITLENILLKTLGFDTDIELPHQDIVRYFQRIKGRYSQLEIVNFPKPPRDLAQAAYYLVTNTLHVTPLFCLRYRPSIVACVCIFMACRWANWELPIHDGQLFYKFIDSAVTDEILEALSNEFTEFAEKSGDKLKIRHYMAKIRKAAPGGAGCDSPSTLSDAPESAYQMAASSSSQDTLASPSFDAAAAATHGSHQRHPVSSTKQSFHPVPSGHPTVVVANNDHSRSLDVTDSVPSIVTPLNNTTASVSTPVLAVQPPAISRPASAAETVLSGEHTLSDSTMSPPPLKRVKTEVLDLNKYKERRAMTASGTPTATVAPGQQTPSGSTPSALPRKSFIPDMSSVGFPITPPHNNHKSEKPKSADSVNPSGITGDGKQRASGSNVSTPKKSGTVPNSYSEKKLSVASTDQQRKRPRDEPGIKAENRVINVSLGDPSSAKPAATLAPDVVDALRSSQTTERHMQKLLEHQQRERERQRRRSRSGERHKSSSSSRHQHSSSGEALLAAAATVKTELQVTSVKSVSVDSGATMLEHAHVKVESSDVQRVSSAKQFKVEAMDDLRLSSKHAHVKVESSDIQRVSSAKYVKVEAVDDLRLSSKHAVDPSRERESQRPATGVPSSSSTSATGGHHHRSNHGHDAANHRHRSGSSSKGSSSSAQHQQRHDPLRTAATDQKVPRDSSASVSSKQRELSRNMPHQSSNRSDQQPQQQSGIGKLKINLSTREMSIVQSPAPPTAPPITKANIHNSTAHRYYRRQDSDEEEGEISDNDDSNPPAPSIPPPPLPPLPFEKS